MQRISSWFMGRPGRLSTLVIGAVVLLMFSRLLFVPGTLGLREDWPIPPLREQNIELAKNDTLYAWGSDALGHPIIRQAGSYIDWLNGLLAQLGASGRLISRYPLIFLLIGGCGMWRLLRSRGHRSLVLVVGTAFYLLAPFVMNAMVGGYLKFFVSYAAIPYLFHALIAFLETGGRRNLLYSAVAFGFVATQANFLVLFSPVVLLGLFIFFLVHLRDISSRKRALLGLLTFLGPLFLQAPLLVEPVVRLIRGDTGTLRASFDWAADTFITLRGPSALQALGLVGAHAEYFYQAIQTGGLVSLFVFWLAALATLLVALIGLLRLKNRWLAVWSLLLILLGWFLFKGPNPPFGELTVWLFTHIPYLSVVRNLNYMTVLMIVPLALLLGAGVEELLQRRRGRAMVLGFLLLFLLARWPMLTGNFAGQVKSYVLHPETRQTYFEHSKDPELDRLLQLPLHQPMAYLDARGIETFAGNNPMVWHAAKPSLWMGVHETYSHLYHNLVSQALHLSPTRRLGYLLSLSGVKEVIFDRGFSSKYPEFITTAAISFLEEAMGNDRVAERLKAQEDFRLLSQGERVTRYQIERGLVSLAQAAPTYTLIVGGPELVALQAELAAKDELARPVIFAAGLSKEGNRPRREALESVWLDPADEVSLVAMGLPHRFSYSPASALKFNTSDPRAGWVAVYKNQWWWYHPNLASAERPVLTFAPEQSFDLPIELEGGTHRLWLKVWRSPRSEGLRVLKDGVELVTIKTGAEHDGGFEWVELPSIDGKGEVKLTFVSTSPSEEAVARLIVAPERVWHEVVQEAKVFLNRPNRQVVVVGEPKLGPFQLLDRPLIQRAAVVSEGAEFKEPVVDGSFEASLPDPADDPEIKSLLPSARGGDYDGPWAVTDQCRGTAPDVALIQAGDAAAGEQYLELIKRTEAGRVCLRQGLKNLDPRAIYRISFMSRWKQGASPSFRIIEDEREGEPAVSLEFSHHREWIRRQIIYRPRPGATGAVLEFGAEHVPESPIATYVDFDNLTIERIDPRDRVTGVQSTSPTFLPDPPKPLAVEKLNPTRYRVTLPSDFAGPLVFLEQYHPDWRIFELDGQGKKRRRVVPSSHVEVNGFGNGFVLQRSLAGKTILLEYALQRLYAGAVGIQAASFLASLMTFLSLGLLWRRRR